LYHALGGAALSAAFTTLSVVGKVGIGHRSISAEIAVDPASQPSCSGLRFSFATKNHLLFQ